jgi:phage tail protein X
MKLLSFENVHKNEIDILSYSAVGKTMKLLTSVLTTSPGIEETHQQSFSRLFKKGRNLDVL